MVRSQRPSPFSTNSPTPSTTSEFVDEKFEVIPETRPIQPITEDKDVVEEKKRGPGRPPITPLTEQETIDFLKGTLTIPHIFLPKLPYRTDDQIKPFAHELYLYCIKKGIDVRDWLFDEFGLVVTGATLARSYYDDYRYHYPKSTKKELAPEDKKLNADYDHHIEVEEKNKLALENKILEGVTNG